jgi:lambda family phage portal protein
MTDRRDSSIRVRRIGVLDNVIAAISPAWAWRREVFRQGLQAMRNYDAGRHDRLTPWTPAVGPAEQIDASYRDTLRARARDLERNNDVAGSAIGAIIRNVVGTGIRPQARVRQKDSDEYDERLNAQLEEEFAKWAKASNCDISGQQSFYELQAMILRRRVVDGEIFIHKVTPREKQRIPLELQVLESDLLDASLVRQTSDTSNAIVSGIELNPYYRPVQYWFQAQSPDGYVTVGTSTPIKADRIIHLYSKIRPSQIRGVSELAQVMIRMRETGEYLDAELVAAKIAACYALFVKKDLPTNPVGRLAKDTTTNKRIDTIEPGMIEYLLPGEEIQAANPSRSATTVRDFTEIETRLIAAGMGMSYEVVSRDMSKSNYSSARQNHLEDRKTWLPMQAYMVEHFCRPIWEEFVKALVLSGRVDIPDFWEDPERYFVCDWIAPGWAWIDPLKEVNALRAEVGSGMITLQQICAEKGLDWQEVLRQRAREQQYAQSLGLQLDFGSKSAKVEGGGDDGEAGKQSDSD